jgi:hypothetical protein
MGTIAGTLVKTPAVPSLLRDMGASFPMRLWVTDLVTALPLPPMLLGRKMFTLPVVAAGSMQSPIAGKGRTGRNQDKRRCNKPCQYRLFFHGFPSVVR